MYKVFTNLWSHRSLFFSSVAMDIRSMYAGTIFGIAWVVLGPILLLTLYSVIYAVIFKVRVPDFTAAEYILNLFSGLVPFLAFAQSLSASSSVLKKEKKLLFIANYPAEFVPTKAVFVAYSMLVVGVIMTFIGDAIWSTVTWTWLLVPVVVFFQVLFSIGVGFFLSLLSIVIKDIQVMIQYIVIALLVVTPIAYTPDMIPEKLLSLLYVNPLFYFVYSYQNLILLNELPPTSVVVIGVSISVITFILGLWFFSRARQALSDLL